MSDMESIALVGFFEIDYCFQWESSYCTVVKNVINIYINGKAALPVGNKIFVTRGKNESEIIQFYCGQDKTESKSRKLLGETEKLKLELVVRSKILHSSNSGDKIALAESRHLWVDAIRSTTFST